jgi:hypothetical protein
MGLYRAFFFLTILVIVPAKDLVADENAPSPAPLTPLHVQIVDPGQKAVYVGILRDLPDSRGIPGEWVKHEALRSALERDPDLAFRALQMVAHPGEIPVSDQIAVTQEQFDLAMKVLKAAPSVTPPGVATVVASFDQFSDAARAVGAFWLKQEGLDPAQANREIMNMIENQPGVLENLVGRISNNLSDPTISPDLISMDGKLRGQLEGLIKEGRLPDINGDQQHLVDGLSPNAVTEELASLLAGVSGEQIAEIRGDHAKMLAFLEKNRDALVGQALVLDDLQKKTDALLANAAAQQMREAHERAVADARGGVAAAAGLLRLFDPEDAAAANDLATIGNAIIDGEEAISSLASGFSLAASGNLIGAAGKIVDLFSHHTDIAAIYQQQIMNGLSQISQQLREITQKLDIIDNRLTEIQKQLGRLATVQANEFQATLVQLNAISNDLSGIYAEELDLASDAIRKDIIGIHTDCLKHVQENEFDVFSDAAKYMVNRCFIPLSSNTETHEIDASVNMDGFTLNEKALSNVQGREQFPAMLIGPYFAIEADAKKAPPSFSGLINADVWYWGLYSYVDLLYLAPASYVGSNAVQNDLAAFRTAGATLKKRIDGFDPTLYVHDALVSYYRTIRDLSRQDLHDLRQAFKGGAPASDSLPDSFVAGFDLQDSLDAARCRKFMPDFFVRYHDQDKDGSLVRQCGSGARS